MGETRPHAPSALAEGVARAAGALLGVETSRGSPVSQADAPQYPADLGPLEKGVQTAAFKLGPTPVPGHRPWKFKYFGSRLKILRGAWQQQTQILWEKFV